MSDAPTLSKAVESIKTHAERKEAAKNVGESVADARGTASKLNDDLFELAEAVQRLQFFRQILVEMFGEDVPESVHSALDEAKSAVEPEQDAVVDGLTKNPRGERGTPVNELHKDVTGAKRSIKYAEEGLNETLRTHQNKWENRLSSARELQDIIGEQNDEFIRTVNWLESIIENKVQNPENSASAVIREWKNATNQWENHQHLQGLDAFQRTHDLSDDAIDAVERLRSSSDLPLADVDVEVLEELQRIDQLSESVKLSI